MFSWRKGDSNIDLEAEPKPAGVIAWSFYEVNKSQVLDLGF